MRVWLSGQEFCWAFAYALGSFASHEHPVVQEETQQVQIALTQISSQKEVVAQAAVEVFDQGTASVDFVHRVDDSFQYIMAIFAHPLGKVKV